MIEPLPDELRRLIAAETDAPVASDAAQSAVRAKLGATLGIAAVSATAATGKAAAATAASSKAAAATVVTSKAAIATAVTTKAALTIKLLSIVVGVAVVGTTTVAVVSRVRSSEPAARARTVRAEPNKVAPASASRTSSAAARPAVSEPAVEPATEAATEPTIIEHPMVATHATGSSRRHPVKTVVPAEPISAPAGSTTRTQTQLLADASRSLSIGEPERTLELVDEDLLAHGNGPLAEDREALRVSALLALGRHDAARDAARHLVATYPRTLHRALVERALNTKDSP